MESEERNSSDQNTPIRGMVPHPGLLISGSSLNMTTTDAESISSGHLEHAAFSATTGKPLYSEFVFPIQGYEVLEARSKFTVFKIKVQHVESGQQWFIFRRYTDFARLNKTLRMQFPGLRLALPPKRWFGDNFDPCFLEDRMLGLQAFITNVTSHPEISSSVGVRQFFCIDEPPNPRDSPEETRLLCDSLEETVGCQERLLEQKDLEIASLKAQLALLRQQYAELVGRLKAGRSGSVPSLRRRVRRLASPASQRRPVGTDGTPSAASLTDLMGGTDSELRPSRLRPRHEPARHDTEDESASAVGE